MKTVIQFLNLQHTNSSQMVRNDLAVSCSKRLPSQMHPLEPFTIFHMNPQVRARAVTVQPPLMIAISQRGETHPILPSYSSETAQLLVAYNSPHWFNTDKAEPTENKGNECIIFFFTGNVLRFSSFFIHWVFRLLS